MSDNCRVSEALYVGLCGYIGTPTDVTVRREVVDMFEMIQKPFSKRKDQETLISGSYREGFRFESSDRDTMVWNNNNKVIIDLSQSSFYDLSKHAIILMEDTDTPPGFVRLQLLTSLRDESTASSIVAFEDGLYLSSERWKNFMLNFAMENAVLRNAKSHGPCVSGFFGDIETDCALCFHCSFWSRLTCYWRKRCTLHNWPPNHVFDAILRNGYHFVPVGIKIAADENKLYWRSSFSQAEQKLVYSMNHTQFLCYGLLKIFLKEVVNRDIEEPFLCSYFMKTTMFWLIQIGHITWCPNKLLDCFWKCFKYLLHCVHRGVLPNFFIPHNNMFSSKLSTVKGERTRECLLEQLNGYYEMGVTCLLQSPRIRAMLEPVICNSLVRVETFLVHIKSAADTDIRIIEELSEIRLYGEDILENHFILRSIIVFLNQSLTEYESLTLQTLTADVLVNTSFLYLNSSTDSTHKKVFRLNRLICNLLKLAGRVGDVSRLLFLAMYYYRTCRYREAIHVTYHVKLRLMQPYIIYNGTDRESYNECVASWSLSKRMKKAWVYDVCLDNYVYYIQEIVLEQTVSLENGEDGLYTSPYVFMDMLSVLCNYRLGNRSLCLQSLTCLQTLLLNDDGRYVPLRTRDLSWQILGICQHVVGDLHGALQSYQVSMRQRPCNKIQNATKYREALILQQLNERY